VTSAMPSASTSSLKLSAIASLPRQRRLIP
jgi:hypothetical protein